MSRLSALALGLLLQADPLVDAVFQAQAGEGKIDPKKLQETVETLRKRFDRRGLKAAELTIQGEDRIRVRVGAVDADAWSRYKDLILTPGRLELLEVADPETQRRFMEKNFEIKEEGWVVLPRPGGEKCVLKSEPIVTSEHVSEARAARSPMRPNPPSWQVEFKLNEAGSKRFFEATQRLSTPPEGQDRGSIAIVVDGAITSTPIVQSAIRDSGVITGNFTENQARDLAASLQSGRLAYPLKLESEKWISDK